MEIAVLALGCFWGPEIKFSKIDGIIKTEVGYCGGNSSITTYKEDARNLVISSILISSEDPSVTTGVGR